jgi:hypothetical protein
MKGWAVWTVLLYALALLLLTAPIVLISFGAWAKNNVTFISALKMYLHWAYWLFLAVLVAGQALLLLLPLDNAEKRLPSRRRLKVPVIVSGFFLANLFLAGLFCLSSAAAGDKATDYFNLFRVFAEGRHPHGLAGNGNGWGTIITAFFTMLIFWAIWAALFRSFAKADEPDALIKRATRWMLCGSILELLVAVPSHVIVRRREDCCAPAGTFWGIATGISVMLLCFGPGVFYLFVERFERLKPRARVGQTRWHN